MAVRTKKISLFNFMIKEAQWKRLPKLRSRLEKAAAATLAELPRKFHFAWSATLLLTNDARMRRFNRDFRGIDKPTDVLSFPQFEPCNLPKAGRERGMVELGDIILAYQYIVVESRKEHKILINHLTHLVIHGLLHLFGYDHQTGKDAGRMERLEKKIMLRLGLPDPYGILSARKGKNRIAKREKRKP